MRSRSPDYTALESNRNVRLRATHTFPRAIKSEPKWMAERCNRLANDRDAHTRPRRCRAPLRPWSYSSLTARRQWPRAEAPAAAGPCASVARVLRLERHAAPAGGCGGADEAQGASSAEGRARCQTQESCRRVRDRWNCGVRCDARRGEPDTAEAACSIGGIDVSSLLASIQLHWILRQHSRTPRRPTRLDRVQPVAASKPSRICEGHTPARMLRMIRAPR